MLPHLDGSSDDRPSRRSPGSSGDDSDSGSVGVSVSAHALFSLPFVSRQSRTEFDPQRILEAASQLQRQRQMLRAQGHCSASSELRYDRELGALHKRAQDETVRIQMDHERHALRQALG